MCLGLLSDMWGLLGEVGLSGKHGRYLSSVKSRDIRHSNHTDSSTPGLAPTSPDIVCSQIHLWNPQSPKCLTHYGPNSLQLSNSVACTAQPCPPKCTTNRQARVLYCLAVEHHGCRHCWEAAGSAGRETEAACQINQTCLTNSVTRIVFEASLDHSDWLQATGNLRPLVLLPCANKFASWQRARATQ